MKPLTGCFLLLVLLLFWTVFCRRLADQARTAVNAVLVGFIAFIILYATILTRTPGDYDVVLRPFAALMEAKEQPELYREMLMNVFLFFPLGLTLSNALPRRWNFLVTEIDILRGQTLKSKAFGDPPNVTNSIR